MSEDPYADVPPPEEPTDEQAQAEKPVAQEILAERSVLGACMLDQRVIPEVIDVVTAGDFLEPKHESVFDAILRLLAASEPVDVLTVTDELTKAGEIQKVGVADLHVMVSEVTTASNAGYYAGIVREAAVRRRMLEFGLKMQQEATEGRPVDDLVEDARSSLDKVSGVDKVRVAEIGARFEHVVEQLGTPPDYVQTPWWELNQLIGGLRPGTLNIVGARPGDGKTIMGLQFALSLASEGNVAFSALEMSQDQMLERIIANLAQVPMGNLSRRDLGESEWARIASARGRVQQLPVFFDDRSSVTITQIRSFARSVARKGPLKGVVVDYLQLISPGSSSNKATHELVGEAAKQCKLLARELDVPVVLLSQLSREAAVTHGKDKKPVLPPPSMRSLSQSDQIGHHADLVMLLQRPLNEAGQPKDELDVYVPKNRHGRVGKRTLLWEGQFARVVSRPPRLY